ncbi:MAG: hypothetical protein GY845_35815 [Planctomycetes bacterium]|nr:hypothetical protein [Planctomycetota bacterium]
METSLNAKTGTATFFSTKISSWRSGVCDGMEDICDSSTSFWLAFWVHFIISMG